jgi:hypothetical protein
LAVSRGSVSPYPCDLGALPFGTRCVHTTGAERQGPQVARIRAIRVLCFNMGQTAFAYLVGIARAKSFLVPSPIKVKTIGGEALAFVSDVDADVRPADAPADPSDAAEWSADDVWPADAPADPSDAAEWSAVWQGDAESDEWAPQGDAIAEWQADADGEWAEAGDWRADASWSPGRRLATTAIGEEAREAAGGGTISDGDSPITGLAGLLPGAGCGKIRI